MLTLKSIYFLGEMQTILGSGGAIADLLAVELKQYTSMIRLVSRNPEKVNKDDEILSADLTQGDEVNIAVKGSEVVYLTVGLAYDIQTWQAQWPLIMRNIIAACKRHSCKLVFLDNVYMYDPLYLDNLTEEVHYRPISKKGEVRAEIARSLENDMKRGYVKAAIARCADYYGPGKFKNDILRQMVFENFKNGRPANWLCGVKFRHSFTYTVDAAKAIALIGNTEEAYNEVWHLPTSSESPTGKEWINEVAKQMGVKTKYRIIRKPLLRFLAMFNPLFKEIAEMAYQYDRDYVFNSSKFEKHFNFNCTSYKDGIKTIVEQDYK